MPLRLTSAGILWFVTRDRKSVQPDFPVALSIVPAENTSFFIVPPLALSLPPRR